MTKQTEVTDEQRELCRKHALELRWCDAVGGMGLDRHEKVRAAAATLEALAEAISAHDAAMGELRAEIERLREHGKTLVASNTRFFEAAREAAAQVSTLSAELEKARKDAERYRWLRDTDDGSVESKVLSMYDGECLLVFGPSLDSIIDSAIAAQPGNGREVTP